MGRFISYLLSLSLVFSPFQVYSPMTVGSLIKTLSDRNKALSSIEYRAPAEIEREVVSDNNIYNVDNFMAVALGGYCSINIPLSHMQVENSSTDSVKNVIYKDNKTRLIMSYAQEIDPSTDMAGYVANQLAGLNTTTNNKEEKTYNGVTWYKITSDQTDGVNAVYIYYTTNTSNTSVFWIKASVYPDANNEEYDYVMDKTLETYQLLMEHGTVFQTPDMYNNENQDKYKSADMSNTVFDSRGGFVTGYDISDDWRDLEILVDGNKLKVPCTLKDLYNSGFEINDKIITEENMMILPDRTIDIEMINNKGTVITASAYNDSNQKRQVADDAQIIKLVVDPTKFVSFADKEDESESSETEEITEEGAEVSENKTPSENETPSENKTPSENDAGLDEHGVVTDERIKEIADETKAAINERPNLSEIEVSNDLDDAQSADQYIQKLTEEYLEEKQKIASGEIKAEESKYSESEKAFYEKQETIQNTKKSSSKQAESNTLAHEIILPGGVTLSISTDDLIAFYGENCSKAKFSDHYDIKWEADTKYMVLRTGLINGITRIEMCSMNKF